MPQETIGHYKFLQTLGSGGMGTVYLAEDMTLGRLVAIKSLRPCSEDLHLERDRFLQEARVVSQIDHPNVVTLHEVIHREDGCYLVMQYVPGATLREAMDHRSLSYEESIRYATEIAEGLRAAHASGIVHRDIKPDNVKLSETGACKILDFGVSHLVDKTSLTPAGTMVGTLPYMPPEQIEGREIDTRADIYSLGALLYEMLCGRVPFPQSQKAPLLKGILHDPPPPLTTLCPELPPGTAQVVDRALAKRPEDRYQSITEMIHDLRLLEDRAVGASRSPTMRLIAPTRKRNLLPALLGALVVAVVLGAGPRVWRHWTAAPENSRILVAPFDGPRDNPELSWMSRGIMDVFIESLAPLGEYDVISRQTTLSALEAGGDSLIDSRALLDGAEALDAGYLITGRYSATGSTLHVTAELQSVADGTVLATRSADARDLEQGFLPALQALVDGLAQVLPRTTAPSGAGTRTDAAITRSLPALRHYLVALEYSETGDYSRACEEMQAALVEDPELPAAHLFLTRYSNDLELRDRHLNLAMKYRHRSEGPLGRIIEATYLETQGDYDEALARYESVLADHPEEKDARLAAAMLYFQTRRFHEAIAEFSVLRIGDPFDYAYYPMFWLAYVEIGRPDKALALLEDWRRSFPDAPTPLGQLIQARHVLGDYFGALDLCDTLAVVAPGADLMPRAFILADLRHMDEAESTLAHLDELAERTFAPGRVMTWKAELCYRRDRFGEGLTLAREAARIQPDGYALWTAGKIAAAAGDRTLADRFEGRLASLVPGADEGPASSDVFSDRRFLHHLRGCMALADDRLSDAVNQFDMALRYSGRTDEPLFRTSLGEALLRAGRTDEAGEALDRVLEQNANYGDALLLLARTRLAQERTSEARDLCRRLGAIWDSGDPKDPRVLELQRIRRAARVVELGTGPGISDRDGSLSKAGG